MEYTTIDDTIANAHHRGKGEKRGLSAKQSARQCGGAKSESIAVTDALGDIICFGLLPDQQDDTIRVALIESRVCRASRVGKATARVITLG